MSGLTHYKGPGAARMVRRGGRLQSAARTNGVKLATGTDDGRVGYGVPHALWLIFRLMF